MKLLTSINGMLMILGSTLASLSYTTILVGNYLFLDKFVLYSFMTIGILLIIVGFIRQLKREEGIPE